MVLGAATLNGNDVARGEIGQIFLNLMDRLVTRIKECTELKSPEQSFLAVLNIISFMMENYRLECSANLQRRKYKEIKQLFWNWFETVETKIPKKFRQGIVDSANEQFQRFENIRFPEGLEK